MADLLAIVISVLAVGCAICVDLRYQAKHGLLHAKIDLIRQNDAHTRHANDTLSHIEPPATTEKVS